MRCEARRVAPEDFGRRVGTLLKRDGPRLVLFRPAGEKPADGDLRELHGRATSLRRVALRNYFRLRFGSTLTVWVIETGCSPQKSR